MENAHNYSLSDFLGELSSKAPVPGGGGASALIGAISAALCSMVANLTLDKPAYAERRPAMAEILLLAEGSLPRLLALVEEDAASFLPLASAFRLPKDSPGRSEILENALVLACDPPMAILKEAARVASIIEPLAAFGAKLAVGDVGVAAAACRCAMEGTVMNLYSNTKLMKNRAYAAALNKEAKALLERGVSSCRIVYQKITGELEETA